MNNSTLSNEQNIPNSSTISHEDANYQQTTGNVAIEMVTFLLLWILSVTGNILVCVVIRRSRRVHSTTNYFVVGIASADILTAIVPMPFLAGSIMSGEWVFGDAMCRLIRLAQYATPGVTMYVLASICIDRYYSIIYPLCFKIKRSTSKRMILVCWISSYVLSSLCMYFFSQKTSDTGGTYKICPTYIQGGDWFGIGYFIALVLLQYIAPALLMIVLYTKVFNFIWKAGITGARRIQRTMNSVSRTKVNMVKMLMITTGVTVILLCPFYVVQIWYMFYQPLTVNQSVYILSIWLVFSTGVIKPLLYMYYNPNFRRGCKEVFCFTSSKYRSNTYAITSASSFGKKNHVGVMNPDLCHRNADSPSKIFDRSTQVDRNLWPIENNNLPSSWQ